MSFPCVNKYLHGHSNLDAHKSLLFTEFISKSGYDPKNFRGVPIDDLPLVEGINERNIFIYDFDIQEGEYVGELARRIIGKCEIAKIQQPYHSYHIDSFLKCFRCPSCDCFFNRSNNFNRHLLTCRDRVRHIYPKNAYTLWKTIFEKLDGFNIPYTEDQKLFSNVAVFDFESICVPTEELKSTETTTWIGKHVLIFVSILSNLQDVTLFLCEKDPELLIIALVSSFELLAEKSSRLQMRTKFEEIENTVNDRVKKIFNKLKARTLTKRLEVCD